MPRQLRVGMHVPSRKEMLEVLFSASHQGHVIKDMALLRGKWKRLDGIVGRA
ncbi:MAG: hypothetical protein WBA62_22465 [Xanthobacteraceae bacterium]|jgi:hypothetical protein